MAVKLKKLSVTNCENFNFFDKMYHDYDENDENKFGESITYRKEEEISYGYDDDDD